MPYLNIFFCTISSIALCLLSEQYLVSSLPLSMSLLGKTGIRPSKIISIPLILGQLAPVGLVIHLHEPTSLLVAISIQMAEVKLQSRMN